MARNLPVDVSAALLRDLLAGARHLAVSATDVLPVVEGTPPPGVNVWISAWDGCLYWRTFDGEIRWVCGDAYVYPEVPGQEPEPEPEPEPGYDYDYTPDMVWLWEDVILVAVEARSEPEGRADLLEWGASQDHMSPDDPITFRLVWPANWAYAQSRVRLPVELIPDDANILDAPQVKLFFLTCSNPASLRIGPGRPGDWQDEADAIVWDLGHPLDELAVSGTNIRFPLDYAASFGPQVLDLPLAAARAWRDHREVDGGRTLGSDGFFITAYLGYRLTDPGAALPQYEPYIPVHHGFAAGIGNHQGSSALQDNPRPQARVTFQRPDYPIRGHWPDDWISDEIVMDAVETRCLPYERADVLAWGDVARLGHIDGIGPGPWAHGHLRAQSLIRLPVQLLPTAMHIITSITLRLHLVDALAWSDEAAYLSLALPPANPPTWDYDHPLDEDALTPGPRAVTHPINLTYGTSIDPDIGGRHVIGAVREIGVPLAFGAAWQEHARTGGRDGADGLLLVARYADELCGTAAGIGHPAGPAPTVRISYMRPPAPDETEGDTP